MALHFKFRSAVEFDSIDIEGGFISVANLKDRIIDAKNLGKGTDFDLLITNAQTGEDYGDDAFLVPKNTSVIIKRVPATRSKPIIRVDDQPKSHSNGNVGNVVAPPALPDVTEDMDDFGLDLYAIPEPLPTAIDAEENSRITAMVNKTALDWQRQTQEGYGTGGGRGFGRLGYGRGGAARGRSYGRATPPQGYVCHRCGQPGHFIQHCPTNGDPAYDIRRVKLPVGIPKTRLKADQEGGYILPDGSVAAMQPDESVFAKEADVLLSIRPMSAEPPTELQCPLCQAIFKDAVMIPCCHYSFCDKCIRQELISKGKCPQCASSRFKNDDLLPNIALRQAIDRFMETQLPTTSTDEAPKPQQVPDVEPAVRAKAPVPAPRLQIELRKPAASLPPPATETVGKEVSSAIAAEPAFGSAGAAVEKVRPGGADSATDASTTFINVPPTAIDPTVAVANGMAGATDATAAAADDTAGATDATAAATDATAMGIATTVATAITKPVTCTANVAAEAVQASAVDPPIEPQNSEVIAVQSSKEDENIAVVQPTVVKRVSDPVKGGMHPVIDDEGGMVVKMSEFPSHREAEGVAVESEFSKGKKKKKRTRLLTGDGAGDYVGVGKGKRMQVDRYCFICGSPEHLARDCLENPELAHPPHPGMFGPGPGGMPPYGPDMYWHGPPMQQHGRPFPVGYGDGMYGPGPMPFEAPMIPTGPYNVGPYMPPMYHHGGPMHGGFMGGGMPPGLGPVERPLSREEFLEMQERERRRRLMQERLQRDWSPERPYSREGIWNPQTPESERRRYEQADRRVTLEEHPSLIRKRELDRDSVRNYSDETEFYKNKPGNQDYKHVSLGNNSAYRRNASNSDDDVASFDELKNGRLIEKRRSDGKTISISTRREIRQQRDDDVERFSSEPEGEIAEQSYSARRYEKRPKDVDLRSLKLSKQSHSKRSEDGKSMHLSESGVDGQSNRHRSKRNLSDGVKYVVDSVDETDHLRSGKHGRGLSRNQDPLGRFHVNDCSGSEVDLEDEAKDVEKPKRRKHHSHSRSKTELGSVVSESEDDLKRKRRKHKKRREEVSQDKGREYRSDADGDHSTKHRRHRSKNGSHAITPSPADLEHTRWQLDSGYETGTNNLWSKRSKHRHSDNGKIK